MEQDKTTYSTTNLYEAAYCLCMGMKFDGYKPIGDEKTIIYLEGQDIHACAQTFYEGGAAEARSLFRSYHELREFITNQKLP